MEPESHPLESVALAMGGRFDAAAVHSAMLVAYCQALYGVVRKMAAPSPLYRLAYDGRHNVLRMEETAGDSLVPEDGSLDVNDLDMLLMGSLRDIPILFEGESGVGKTFISQAFMRTVFPKEGAVSLRLSGSTFLNNVFQPFLEGKIEGGMPVTRIKASAVDGIAAMLVDEINRGDPQNILQLLDNELYNSGAFARLGPEIPELGDDGRVRRSGRRKKLVIVSAQNPSATADAKFTGASQLDAAVDNRLLKISFGNAANSVGSGVWLTEECRDPFGDFIGAFVARTAQHLGLREGDVPVSKENWLSVYPWVTDSSRTDKPILYSALELTDLLSAVLGGDLPRKLQYEARVANAWGSRLGMKLRVPEEARETEEVKKIHDIIATFKAPLIFRDIVQIKKLADVLSTLSSLRCAMCAADPVGCYLTLEKFVGVREVACASALLARGKQQPSAPSATPLVNEVAVQYVSLTEAVQAGLGYLSASFDGRDPNAGIKKPALFRAVRDALKHGDGAEKLAARLGGETSKIAGLAGSGVIRAIMACKASADLLTLAGFVAQHTREVDEALRPFRKTDRVGEAVAALTDFFYERKGSHAAVMGDIFQHRLPRTLGG